jgi:hypothetical protein
MTVDAFQQTARPAQQGTIRASSAPTPSSSISRCWK